MTFFSKCVKKNGWVISAVALQIKNESDEENHLYKTTNMNDNEYVYPSTSSSSISDGCLPNSPPVLYRALNHDSLVTTASDGPTPHRIISCTAEDHPCGGGFLDDFDDDTEFRLIPIPREISLETDSCDYTTYEDEDDEQAGWSSDFSFSNIENNPRWRTFYLPGEPCLSE